MPTTTCKSAFLRGFIDGLPFILTGGPFGLVFGIAATEAGMDLVQTLSMSVLVIGGASQLTALSQMKLDAPVILVLAASLLVNLRMSIYSAALAPHLGRAPFWRRALAAYMMVDNAYAVAIVRYNQEPERSVAWKMAYYFGGALPVCMAWYAATLLGALTGQAIPSGWQVGFAVPVAFVALVAPLVRNLAQLSAIVTATVAVLLLAGMPYNTELLVAALLGMMAGAEVERRRA